MAQERPKIVLLYTLFSSLGDFLVMGDVMHKARAMGAEALCLHLNNPHVPLWKYSRQPETFFNVFSWKDWFNLAGALKRYRRENKIVLGLQQAPGSLRGFYLLSFLKHLGLIDYVVDFNLLNADIVTPARGKYILDEHLHQIEDLMKLKAPEDFFHLSLPLQYNDAREVKFKVGIHPWTKFSSSAHLHWPNEKWLELIKALAVEKRFDIVVFGKDRRFLEFEQDIKGGLQGCQRIHFQPSNDVNDLVGTVSACDIIVSVNTSVVHIAHALDKKMVILQGPSLDLWAPKSKNAIILRDEKALFQAADKMISDPNFPKVSRIEVETVREAVLGLF